MLCPSSWMADSIRQEVFAVVWYHQGVWGDVFRSEARKNEFTGTISFGFGILWTQFIGTVSFGFNRPAGHIYRVHVIWVLQNRRPGGESLHFSGFYQKNPCNFPALY